MWAENCIRGLYRLFFRNHDCDSRLQLESGEHVKRVFQKKRSRIDPRIISDATIGLSDGLTVPFALTAGLSSFGDTRVVIYGGLSELLAGAISMGLGGYLGAQTELASYKSQREELDHLIFTNSGEVEGRIKEIFEPLNLPDAVLEELITYLLKSPRLCEFMIQFQRDTDTPEASRASESALTISLGYLSGGLVPLVPYFFVTNVSDGFWISVALMVVSLFGFGFVKTCVVLGWEDGKYAREASFAAIQMVIVGSVAAVAAMTLTRLVNENPAS